MDPRARLTIRPIGLRAANAVVAALHRHHKPVRGCKFAISVVDEAGDVVGVLIAGRPVSRRRDDGLTLEATRCATNGTPNACSALYAAAWRAARAMGYLRLITYTLATEPGTSLRAAGWRLIGEAKGGTWNRANRPRDDNAPTCEKLLWTAEASLDRGPNLGP